MLRNATVALMCVIVWTIFPQLAEAADDVPIFCGDEPTEDFAIDYGELIRCNLSTGNDTDTFTFTGDVGDLITILASAEPGSFLEPCFQVFEPAPPVGSGLVVIDQCNFSPWNRVNYELLISGTYTILVYDFASSDDGIYHLTIESFQPPSPSAQRIVYNDDPINTETISPYADLDLYTFEGDETDEIVIEMTEIGNNTNDGPCLELYAPNGNSVDGPWQCGNSVARIEAVLPQTGVYTLLARYGIHQNTTGYVLSLSCNAGICTPRAIEPVLCAGQEATIVGTDADDLLNGTAGPDVIVGGKGNDTINGLGGNDLICGNSGTDIIDGGSGNDTIYGGGGDDELSGGSGNDSLYGQKGNDSLHGNAGNDVLDGGPGNDVLFGEEGNDVLFGADGNDIVAGGSGEDSLNGGAGKDRLRGQNGNDSIRGGSGPDKLIGASGNDICDGDGGTDTAIGCELLVQIP